MEGRGLLGEGTREDGSLVLPTPTPPPGDPRQPRAPAEFLMTTTPPARFILSLCTPQPSTTPAALANVPEQTFPQTQTTAQLSRANRRPAPCLGPTSRGDFSFSGESARDPRAAVKVIRKVWPWKPIPPPPPVEKKGGAVRAVGDGFSTQLPAQSSWESNQSIGIRREGTENLESVLELRTTELFFMYLQNKFEPGLLLPPPATRPSSLLLHF